MSSNYAIISPTVCCLLFITAAVPHSAPGAAGQGHTYRCCHFVAQLSPITPTHWSCCLLSITAVPTQRQVLLDNPCTEQYSCRLLAPSLRSTQHTLVAACFLLLQCPTQRQALLDKVNYTSATLFECIKVRPGDCYSYLTRVYVCIHCCPILGKLRVNYTSATLFECIKVRGIIFLFAYIVYSYDRPGC
jgi:hypothetical protein